MGKLSIIFEKIIQITIFIALAVLLIYLKINKYKRRHNLNKEHYQNSDIYVDMDYPEEIKRINENINKKQVGCNAYFGENSFCQYDDQRGKCMCKYQHDEIKYAFDSPTDCCDKQCGLLNREQCLGSSDLKKPTYYCNIGGVCYPRTATILNNRISANNCGIDPLSNQLLLPFFTKEECERSSDVCDIHNNPKFSETQVKDSCLKDPRCGYCINEFNNGKCISGTISGPNDLQKYYYCAPERANKTNFKYQYGDHAAALNITTL